MKSSGTWDETQHAAWTAFDGQCGGSDTCYHTARDAYEGGEHKRDTNLDGKHKGEWLSLQLPKEFIVAGVKIDDRNGDADRKQVTQSGWFLGSSDGENWDELWPLLPGGEAGAPFPGGMTEQKKSAFGPGYKHGSSVIEVGATKPYTHYAMVFERAHVHHKHHNGGMIAIQQMYLYGDYPEKK